jgi:hypothetical protein
MRVDFVKDRTINIRVDKKAHEAIKRAAEALGQSITTFVLESAKREAQRKKPTATPPSFFRARIAEARQGGTGGYEEAGFQLAIHVHQYLSDEHDDDQREAALERLDAGLSDDDDEAVLEWFQEELPKLVKLVPTRRRAQFLKGVRRAWEDDRIGE